MGYIVKHKNKKEGLKPPLLVCNHDKELRQYCKSLALPRFENIMICLPLPKEALAFSALMAYYVY